MPLPVEFVAFPSRAARTQYVHRRFSRYFDERVLDVGCFEAPLRELLGKEKYFGIDIVGAPDIVLNLEQCERLPVDDRSFKTVICIEVLEHLDNLHAMFAELVRTSREHVLISLPNCWSDARMPIGRGKGEFAHYGLPATRPVDRHKWFFNLEQAEQFARAMAQQHQLSIVELFATEKPRNALVQALRRLRYPGSRYQNRYSQTMWALFRRS